MQIWFSENRLIDGDLRRDALSLQRSGDWDDSGPQLAEALGTENGGAATANSQVIEKMIYNWYEKDTIENPAAKIFLFGTRYKEDNRSNGRKTENKRWNLNYWSARWRVSKPWSENKKICVFLIKKCYKSVSKMLKSVCASIFHPRADGPFPLSLPFFFCHR